MRILWRYMLWHTLGPLVVATALLTGLIWLLQLLRLGHAILNAAVDPLLVGKLLLYSLPSLLIFTTPLALAAALLFTLGRLAETNELDAMRLLGASPLRLALPLATLSLIAALITGGLAVQVERPALHRLHDLLQRQAVRVLLLNARPGRFVSISPDVTLYVQQRLPGPEDQARFKGLFLAQQKPPMLLWARRARLEPQGSHAIVLKLRHGELQQGSGPGALRMIRFERLEQQLDLGPAVQHQLGFLVHRAESGGGIRAITAPASCLALGLLCGIIGLGLTRRHLVAGLGTAAVAAYHLALWATGVLWPGPLGALLLAAGVVLGCLLWLDRQSRRQPEPR